MSNTPWQPGYVLEGRYELIQLVGSGGMGVVWRVFDREWDRDLALKLPKPVVMESPPLLERYIREAETWVGLGVHPHIVQCWFVTEVHGVPALFLDYLTGGSLANWLEDGYIRPGQWDLIIEIAMQVTEGLAYAHSKGVVHRDVKPENLLIRGDERVCVTDFGLVKTAVEESALTSEGLLAETEEAAGVTGVGAYLGTPMYGAPEQWGAAERVGPPADIYALGVTLYEMCCGRRPFDLDEEKVPPMTLIRRHLADPPPDPREFYPSVPHELARLCLRMLEKVPGRRPPQMAAVREYLASVHKKLTNRSFRAPAPLLGEQSPDILNNQAVSLASLGKLTLAVESLRRGLGLDPGHPECLYNLVQLEKRHGRIGHLEALRRLKQARAYYPLALLAIEEGLPSEAYEALQNLNPDDHPSPGLVYRARGDAFMYLEDYLAAERAYTQAQQLMPKDASASLRRKLAAERTGKVPGDAIFFPSAQPMEIDHSGDPTLRLLLDDRAEGLIGLTQTAAVYRGLTPGAASVRQERSSDARPVLQAWLHGKCLAIADRKGFELRLLPGLDLIMRRKGRILACTKQLDRMVTLEEAGPQLFTMEKAEFQPINMEGQSPDQGPLLASFDPTGQQLALLLPSGHLGALDHLCRAVPLPWPPRLEGHKHAKCLALTADGSLLVGYLNGAVQSFCIKAQKLEYVVRLPEVPTGFEVHANGTRIIVRSECGFHILSRNGEILLSGEGPLAVDPRGRRAIFFYQGRQVMSNLNPLHVLRRWSRIMEEPKSVAFSGDGRLAVSLSKTGESLIWEIDEAHRVYQRRLLMSPGRGYSDILNAGEQFQRHMELAHQALEREEPAESNRHLQRARKVPGYEHGAVAQDFSWRLLQFLKRDRLDAVWERLGIEGANPGDLDLTGDGRELLFSFGGQACMALDREGGARPVWTQSRQGHIKLLRFLRRGQRRSVIIADESGEATLHNPSDGKMKHSFLLAGGALSQAMLHGSMLTYISRAGGFGQLDLSDGISVYRDDLRVKAKVFGPWQRHQMLIAAPNTFGIIDLSRPGSKLQALRLGVEITKVPWFIDHLADRGLLVLGFPSGTLRVLDIAGGGVLAALPHGEANRVTSFQLLPDLQVALTTTARGYMYVWDLREEQLLDKFIAHRNGVSAVRTSWDGRYLLTAGSDGIVRYWETSWSAGEPRGLDTEPSWLSTGKAVERRGKVMGRGGTTIE